MFGPQRDLEAYIASLTRLSLRDDFERIYPSHAKEEIGRGVITPLIEGAKRILEGELEGVEAERFGRKFLVFDVGVSRFLCDREQN